MRRAGLYRKLGDLNYFIPNSLPPSNPSFELNTTIINLYGEASYALGQLNEMCKRLPDIDRFIKTYIIKEALLSSAIEGIHTTMIDVLTSQNLKVNKDTQLVFNYTQALREAVDMIHDFPLTSRIILQAHYILLSDGENEGKAPGEYRKQSVKVGELIPPPANEVPNLIRDLEFFINDFCELPPLIKAGLAHVQFETIHPFLDGNGRIGRLLIVLMLLKDNLLHLPILYPSYYFKKNHLDYYKKLNDVRVKGDFEGWIEFYLEAIKYSALDAHKRAREIEELENTMQLIIQKEDSFAKVRDSAHKILTILFSMPIAGISEISKKAEKSFNTVSKIIELFKNMQWLEEVNSYKRNRVFQFTPYITLLEKDYD